MDHALITCSNSSYNFANYSESLLITGKCKQIQPNYEYGLNGINVKDSHEIPNYELTEYTSLIAKKWDIKY